MSFPPGSVLRSVRDPRKWGVHEHYFGERTRSTVSMADPNRLPPVYKATRAKRPGGGGAKLGGAICRIKTFARAFDLLRPYNTSQSASGVGTGFVLDAVQIPGGGLAVMTAYHVVDHAVRILVSIDEHSAEPVLSELVLYDHILDIAVLRVPIAPPPSRSNAPPSQKSFCTSTTIKASSEPNSPSIRFPLPIWLSLDPSMIIPLRIMP